MIELLPCPFCGAIVAYTARVQSVSCSQCSAIGPWAASEALACTAWNTRAFQGVKNLSSDLFASIERPVPDD